jgi:hypothetical protein
MPLTPTYTWSETDSSVRITIDGVPIKDQSQLFCSDRLVKLNAPPYLLLLDLKEPVDDDLSTATVLHGRKVVFQLSKVRNSVTSCSLAPGAAAVCCSDYGSINTQQQLAPMLSYPALQKNFKLTL